MNTLIVYSAAPCSGPRRSTAWYACRDWDGGYSYRYCEHNEPANKQYQWDTLATKPRTWAHAD